MINIDKIIILLITLTHVSLKLNSIYNILFLKFEFKRIFLGIYLGIFDIYL